MEANSKLITSDGFTGQKIGEALGGFLENYVRFSESAKARKKREKERAEIDAVRRLQLFNAIREAGRQERIGRAEEGLETAVRAPLDIQPAQLETGYLSDVYGRALGVREREKKAAMDELAGARGDIDYFQKQMAGPGAEDLKREAEARKQERLEKDLDVINDPEIPDAGKRVVIQRIWQYDRDAITGLKTFYPHLFPKEEKDDEAKRAAKLDSDIKIFGSAYLRANPKATEEQVRNVINKKFFEQPREKFGLEALFEGEQPVEQAGASPVAGGGGAVGPVPSAPSKQEAEARSYLDALKQGAKPSELWPDYQAAIKYWLDRKADGTIDQAGFDHIRNKYLSPGFPRPRK